MIILFVLGISYTVLILFLCFHKPEPFWDWENTNTDDLFFPEKFIWGVATSAHQVEEGCDNNNWSHWENQCCAQGNSRIFNNQRVGVACEHWSRFRQDIVLMQELGVTSYRFSVEWSKIEPQQGEINRQALDHYHEVIDALISADIRPMITLLHFTWPLWFDELGAFEKEDNIGYFEEFCELVFKEYSDRVFLWCTINEIEMVSLRGYLLGQFPPGIRRFANTARVMRHMVLAHARVYRRLKRLKGGELAKIGLAKNMFLFDPSRRWFLGDWVLSEIANRLYNGIILDYLGTGRFNFRLPFAGWLCTYDDEVRGAGDFIGLNYYSRLKARCLFSLKKPYGSLPGTDEVMTDMSYVLYPEGIYRALCHLKALNKPIYITECGVADDADRIRRVFIKRHIYGVSRAIQDGVDVRSFYYWSLMDNFEWSDGYSKKFGLFKVDFDTQKRTMRPGAQEFVQIIQNSSENK